MDATQRRAHTTASAYFTQNSKEPSTLLFDSYDAIVDACVSAWNKLTAQTGRIRSIATRE
jgi:hypothetical protein